MSANEELFLTLFNPVILRDLIKRTQIFVLRTNLKAS